MAVCKNLAGVTFLQVNGACPMDGTEQTMTDEERENAAKGGDGPDLVKRDEELINAEGERFSIGQDGQWYIRESTFSSIPGVSGTPTFRLATNREVTDAESFTAAANAAAAGADGAVTGGQQLAADVAREKQAAADNEFIQKMAQQKFEFDALMQQNADSDNAQMAFEIQKLNIEEERAKTNMKFLISQEQNAVAASNRTAQLEAKRQIETTKTRIARTNTERVQIAQVSADANANRRAVADQFNASMQFEIDNENQRRTEFNVTELRATANDIAEFSKNPGDVGKIAAFLRAGGGGALTEAAQGGEVGFTDESLAPLRGFLGNKAFLEQGPELATFDPVEAQQTEAPVFDPQDTTVPTVADLAGAPLTFDPTGIQGPATEPIDDTNLFVDPVVPPTVSPPTTDPAPTGPVTSGGTPIVQTAPGAAEPIVRNGEVVPVEPVVSPGAFTALKPSGEIDADLAEFDRRIAESGIDPEAAAGMRAKLAEQSQERAGLLEPMAKGGVTNSPFRLVGEEGPEIEMDMPDGRTMVIPNDMISEMAEGGTFSTPEEIRAFSASFEREGDPTTFNTDQQAPALRTPEDIAAFSSSFEREGDPTILNTDQTATPERQPLGLASAEEANIFQQGVGADALRRFGLSSVAEAAPIKVSAPGTSSFLQEGAQGVFGAFGLGDERTFLERLNEVRATGVSAGTSRRTA